MMLGPPRKFSKIFISRLIFFFFTGWKGKSTSLKKLFQDISTGSIIHKWFAYELLEGRKCVRHISEVPSPSPLPGTLQLLSNTELKENKDFYSKHQNSAELAFNSDDQS